MTVNGRQAKIEIEEYAPNGIFVEGFDVRINSEYVGRALRTTPTRMTGKRMTEDFQPFSSKYGEIRIVRNANLSLVGSELIFDVFISGDYAGSVNMPTL